MKAWHLYNTPENEKKLIDAGFSLPEDYPKGRFKQCKYIYGSFQWLIQGTNRAVREVHNEISQEYMSKYKKCQHRLDERRKSGTNS